MVGQDHVESAENPTVGRSWRHLKNAAAQGSSERFSCTGNGAQEHWCRDCLAAAYRIQEVACRSSFVKIGHQILQGIRTFCLSDFHVTLYVVLYFVLTVLVTFFEVSFMTFIGLFPEAALVRFI